MCESDTTWPTVFVGETFHINLLHQYGKGRHILSAIINTEEKVIKIVPMRAGCVISETFLLVKFPAIQQYLMHIAFSCV